MFPDILQNLLTIIESWLLPYGITPETIESWFKFDKDAPLLFSSALFLGFFLVFYLLYFLTRKFHYFRTVYVILFSMFFYYKAGGMLFLLLIGSCIVNYVMSEAIYSQEDKKKKKVYLVFSIVANLLVLGYYKYTNFLIFNINEILESNFAFHKIAIPVGISFYTFQAISYTVDVYKREIEPARNILDFTFYLSFFPQLVAGPIVRAKEFLPQIYKKITLTREQAGLALFMILTGLIKKAVISDYISLNFVDRVFESPLSYTSFENLMAVYGYTLQIYCDFSGYSDMAIGLALLMGFTLPENFNTPYKSLSVTEFWRRWHISLSSWLRDYLYIPLGGNRKGKVRTYINLFLTMLIGGLWHGAAWKYVVWGGLHGLALAVERFFKQFFKVPNQIVLNLICFLLTFHFVAFCWIFFRAKDFAIATTLIQHIGDIDFNFSLWKTILISYQNVFLLMFIGFLFHFLPKSLVNYFKALFIKSPLLGKAIIIGFVFWIVFATASSGPQPFIYFDF